MCAKRASVQEPQSLPQQPLELTNEQKFQAVLARFRDHVEILRAITQIDLQVLGGFMTLQLALAAWLVDHPPKTCPIKVGLLLLSGILTALSLNLLYNSYRRRKEVVASLKNTKAVLRFGEKGVYLQDKALDAKMPFRPWLPLYFVVCCLMFLMVGAIILFGF